MGRRSPRMARVIVCTPPELYTRFYRVKRLVRRYLGHSLSNAQLLTLLLDVFEERLAEERKKRVLTSY